MESAVERVISVYIILVYDIVMDEKGKKILPKVFKCCKKYLNHIQNSVFEGVLSEAKLKQLEIDIKKIIRKDVDSVIMFKSRNERWLEKEYWGVKEDNTSMFI